MKQEGFVEIEAGSLEDAIVEASKKTGIAAGSLKYEVVASKQYGSSSKKRNYVKIRVLLGEKNGRVVTGNGGDANRKILALLDEAQNFAETRDGYFLVTCTEDKVYLTVFHHQGKGRPISLKEIQKKLDDPKYQGIDMAAIKAAVEQKNSEKPFKIATINPVFRDIDAKPIIEISDDRMYLHIKFLPPQGRGRFPNLEAVLDKIRAMGVTAKPDIHAIENLIRNKISDSRVLAASGKPPIVGEDTHVNWSVERLNPEKVIYYRPDGSVDFRKIYELSNVRIGQVIGTLEKAGPGIPGENLFGAKIPAKHGIDKAVVFGQNIGTGSDGVSIEAKIDGQIKVEAGTPCIYPTFEVKGDVDFSVGNIEFNGSVVVSGGVLDGFSIKAGGNIFIEKTVGEAALEAEGDIYLAAGFLGKTRGKLKSDKNILIKFAEGGIIEARGNVAAVSAIIHSRVIAGEKIEVLGKRGQIVGGELFARDEIVARAIGAPMGIPTRLTVGFDTIIQDEYEKVKQDIQIAEKEIEKVNQLYNYLASSSEREDKKNSSEHKAMLERAEKTRTMLENKKKFLTMEKDKLYREILDGPRGEISAVDVIRGGVTVNIKNVIYAVNSDIKASKLHLDDDGEVRIYPL